MAQNVRIQVLHGTTTDWTTGKYSTLVLKKAEPALNLDNGEMKYGDGVNTWSALKNICNVEFTAGLMAGSIFFNAGHEIDMQGDVQGGETLVSGSGINLYADQGENYLTVSDSVSTAHYKSYGIEYDGLTFYFPDRSSGGAFAIEDQEGYTLGQYGFKTGSNIYAGDGIYSGDTYISLPSKDGRLALQEDVDKKLDKTGGTLTGQIIVKGENNWPFKNETTISGDTITLDGIGQLNISTLAISQTISGTITNFLYPEKSGTIALREDIDPLNTKLVEVEKNIEVLNKVLIQSGTMYTADIEDVYDTRLTADGLNVLDGSKAKLKKVVGSTVRCENLLNIDIVSVNNGTDYSNDGNAITYRGNVGSAANLYDAGQIMFPNANKNTIETNGIAVQKDKTYTISFDFLLKEKGAYASDIRCLVDNSNLTTLQRFDNINGTVGSTVLKKLKFTATEDGKIGITFRINNNYVTLSNIQVREGDYTNTELPPYQPYFTGLKSASFAGIESGGRNLISLAGAKSANGVTVTLIDNNTLRFSGTPTKAWAQYFSKDITDLLVDGKAYCISTSKTFANSGTANHFYAAIEGFRRDTGTKENIAIPLSVNSASFTVNKEIYSNYILSIMNGKLFNDTVDYTISFMLNHGSTALPYTPYIEPTVFDFPKTEMPLGRTIDFENKKITDYGVTLVLTGAEHWTQSSYTIAGKYYTCLTAQNILKHNENRAGGVTTDGTLENHEYYRGRIWIGVNSKSLYWIDIIRILGLDSGWANADDPTPEEKEKTILDFKAYLAQRYADGNPVTIRYVSSTSQSETNFTDGDEYTAWKNGMEKVRENDGAEHGADNTLTQNYIIVMEVK